MQTFRLRRSLRQSYPMMEDTAKVTVVRVSGELTATGVNQLNVAENRIQATLPLMLVSQATTVCGRESGYPLLLSSMVNPLRKWRHGISRYCFSPGHFPRFREWYLQEPGSDFTCVHSSLFLFLLDPGNEITRELSSHATCSRLRHRTSLETADGRRPWYHDWLARSYPRS